MRTVDVTPSWQAVMPVLIAALCDGTDKGKSAANEELHRMASLLDELGAKLKALEQYDKQLASLERIPTGEDYNEVLRVLGLA